MRTIVIDYNRIGRAKTFHTTLFSDEREGIAVGTHVLVAGDDVPEREAIVTGLTDGGREVELAFCDVTTL
jgi:hypothetical protein